MTNELNSYGKLTSSNFAIIKVRINIQNKVWLSIPKHGLHILRQDRPMVRKPNSSRKVMYLGQLSLYNKCNENKNKDGDSQLRWRWMRYVLEGHGRDIESVAETASSEQRGRHVHIYLATIHNHNPFI